MFIFLCYPVKLLYDIGIILSNETHIYSAIVLIKIFIFNLLNWTSDNAVMCTLPKAL